MQLLSPSPRPRENGLFPEHKEDLLWYKPDDEPLHKGRSFTHVCKSCDVRWSEKIPYVVAPRCFCCGKFINKVDLTRWL